MPWGKYLLNNLHTSGRAEKSAWELIGEVTLLIKKALADGAQAICDSSHLILFY